MKSSENFDLKDWDAKPSKEVQNRAVKSLEGGFVLYFPHLPFTLSDEECRFLNPEK